MANEKNGILERGELQWDVALRGIGIQLPDEYVIRFNKLAQAVNMAGVENITLDELTDIELSAREEMKRRLAEKEKED